MTIYKDTTVLIPDHSYAQGKGNVVYNYTYTSFFRNEDGKPRNTSKATGVRIPGSNTHMHPNDNYYSMMKIPRVRVDSDILNIGFTAVTEAAFADLGLDMILAEVFGNRRAKQIRSICAYMVKEGCVMSYIDHFTQEEYFRKVDEVISSQMVSDIFMEISEEEMVDFYNYWIPQNLSENYICYDVTSISTYSRMLEEAEYGYNRDHDKLAQLNIGLFTSEENKYPLYLERYNGSINDASNIVHACRNAKRAGLKGNFKAVMDGGFFDDAKLNELNDEGIILSVGMPAYLDIAKAYVDQYGGDLFNSKYYVGHDGTYGKIINDQEVFGINGRVFVGLCTEASAMLNEDLDEKLCRFEEEMETIAKYSTVIKIKKYTDLFDFEEIPGSKKFTVKRNDEKIRRARNRFGYFCIFTTDMKATPTTIIDAYRDKDFDEKQFYDLKQYMDARRPRVQNQRSFNGKYFVLLIALILRTWLKKQLGNYKKAHHLTLKRCMMKLSDIKMLADVNQIRLVKAITKEQRELLHACMVDAETLEDSMRQALLESGKYSDSSSTIKSSGS